MKIGNFVVHQACLRTARKVAPKQLRIGYVPENEYREVVAEFDNENETDEALENIKQALSSDSGRL